MVSVSALLALANWLEIRKKAVQKEDICLTANMKHKQAGVKKRGKSATSFKSTLGGDNKSRSARNFTGVQPNSGSELARTSNQHRRGAK